MAIPTSKDPSLARLRALRDARQAEVAEATVHAGQITEEQIEALNRLSRLVELEESRRARHRSARGLLMATTAATLVVLSVLLFARVSATDVELDVAVSHVRFVVPVRHPLTDVLAASRLGIGGLREAAVPRALGSKAQMVRASEGDVALEVSPGTVGGRRGSVNLDALILPANTPVSVKYGGAPRRYRLEVGGTTSDLHVSLFGPTNVSVSGMGRRALEFDVPSDMLMRSGTGGLVLDLELPEGVRSTLVPQLPVTQVSFQAVDETTDGDRTIVRRVSTILSGTIYLESLNGKSRTLRAGEVIQFERSEGELRSVRFEDDRLVLNFQGRVGGMTVGREGNQVSLMPTWLEWLQARHSLSLFWAAALYAFGVITAVFRWFGRTV